MDDPWFSQAAILSAQPKKKYKKAAAIFYCSDKYSRLPSNVKNKYEVKEHGFYKEVTIAIYRLNNDNALFQFELKPTYQSARKKKDLYHLVFPI